jgi:hypothetical protein
MSIKISQLGDFIINELTSKTLLEIAGKTAVESIQKRTRVGKGVTQAEGQATPLPKLARSTIARRKKEITKNKETVQRSISERAKDVFSGNFKKAKKSTKTKTTSTKSANVDPQFFFPAKSNLTFTGEMIRSVDYKVGDKEVDIFLKDNESQRKAEAVLKINPNYEFMNLSEVEVKRIITTIAKELKIILKKLTFSGL